MKSSHILLIGGLLLTLSSVSNAYEYCPKGEYSTHLRYVGINYDKGLATFAVTETKDGLDKSKEYAFTWKEGWDWFKVRYATALQAAATGAQVYISCDGWSARNIYVYNQ
jgi:hypothetical protein